MPTNVTYEYTVAEKKFHEAVTIRDKIFALQEMLRACPTHKGCENLRNQIKQKIARLKKEQIAEKKSKGKSFSIKKEGAAQVTIVGLPNSGKSTLLSELSGKKVAVADYPFTTKKPEIRMIPYKNVKIQGIEIPAIYEGFSQTSRGKQLLSIVRNSDLVIVIARNKADENIIIRELEKVGIKAGKEKSFKDFIQYLPFIIVREFEPELKDKIWKKVNKIAVQTKTKAGIARKPVVLRAGATVGDVARIIHKDFVKNFKYAKIWGPSAKFKGQQVGLDHKLEDDDIIEIFTK